MPSHQSTGSYRLQLHAAFTFADVEAILPYLHTLGVTDLYTSPFLKASPGSRHGYDIGDHTQLNPSIGTEAAFGDLSRALRSRSMGLIFDFVPNHMGLDARTNHWWRSVLMHGRGSPFADYFDIDWDPVTPELKNRLLLPILQNPYGEVLEQGELRLACDEGAFHLRYGDRDLPLDPKESAPILRDLLAHDGMPEAERLALEGIAAMLERLPNADDDRPAAREKRQRDSTLAEERLAFILDGSPAVGASLDRVIDRLNGTPGDPRSFDRLHELLDRQPYRLAFWRTAADEINYRRFFDVNDLGGLRIERPEVFDDAHRLILRFIGEGMIGGLRIDHPDGLFDPAAYFRRLQAAAGARLSQAPGATDQPTIEAQHGPLFIVAEKILADGETLPEGWPIAGTTGYGFMNVVNGLFVDARHEKQLTRLYGRISGRRARFSEVSYQAKRLIMGSSLASELTVLAGALRDIAAADRLTRDFTLNALRRGLVETVACFPVYRTYVDAGGFSASDREAVDVATDRARRRNPVIASSLFLFLRGVLLATAERAPDGVDAEAWLAARRSFAMRFQQFSAPVEAKGVEDTAFYRYPVLLSLNEVGGDPSRFGGTAGAFHQGNRMRLEHWPLEMVATSTHDTKRGEDARARLNVLSEMPQAWQRAVFSWMRINAKRRTLVDGDFAPDRHDEYLYYQSLLGAWPAEAERDPVPAEASAEFVARMQGYMQKAIKEAKEHTSWVNANAAYEEAVARFVETTLRGRTAKLFLAQFVPFTRDVARLGMVNALAQLTLKIAAPGLADFYQGCELWNFDLADPDNRRPVDYGRRQAMLDTLLPWIERATMPGDAAGSEIQADLEGHVHTWLDEWHDARIKMFITACGLRLRRQDPDLFLRGSYDELSASGGHASQVVAFARTWRHHQLIVVVPRLKAEGSAAARRPVGADAWGDTTLALSGVHGMPWIRNILTGAPVEISTSGSVSTIAVADALRTCPVALLRSGSEAPVSGPS
jgi:(1->4)-alpha-D-glucan 1-alpha-D-glucosylmutase